MHSVGVAHVEAMISAGEYSSAAEETDALLTKHGAEACVCHVAVLPQTCMNCGAKARHSSLLEPSAGFKTRRLPTVTAIIPYA